MLTLLLDGYDAAGVPAQPSTPWGTPWLAFADSVRVVCVVVACSMALLAGVYVVGWRGSAAGRLASAALVLLAASAAGTEYLQVGTIVTYRLWTNLLGVLFGLACVVLLLRRPGER